MPLTDPKSSNPFMTIALEELRMGAIGSMAPLPVELVDWLAISVAPRFFVGMDAILARSLHVEVYARMKDFVR
jgi:hypothetical protein